MKITISDPNKSETFNLENDNEFKRYVHILLGSETL